MHALTGCDTVSALYGIGKGKDIKALRQGSIPRLLGDKDVKIDNLIDKAVPFVASCYGSKVTSSMSDIRFNVWQRKTACGRSNSFKLASLPQTSAAFYLHVQRAQYQACLLVSLNPTDFG